MRLRSPLFVPGNNDRRIEKAFELTADAVIMDLEDACPVSEKKAGRAAVASALAKKPKKPTMVRVNGLETAFAYQDILAIVGPHLQAIMLPKAETAKQIAILDWLLNQLELDRGLRLGAIGIVPLVETTAGVSNAALIACASNRVRMLAFGAADYTLDLGCQWSRNELELLLPRQALVAASRLAGIEPPLDTPWIALDDENGFSESVARSRVLGFQGKLCIHPNQLPAVNSAFQPTDEELRKATAIIAAFEKAQAEGSAAIRMDGGFVDYPVVERARRVVATARLFEQ